MSLKKKKLVSIILNCFNGEKFLKKTLDSIKQQSYKNWELIFIDNHSTDNSKLIFKSYKDKRFKYFKTKKHLSLYSARNFGVNKSKGDFISFIDADDWWIKNKIEKQITLFFKNHNLDIVFSNVFIYEEKNKKKKLFIKKKIKFINSQSLINKFEMPILTTMIKKKIFKSNKFNKQYTIIGDFDFFTRLAIHYNIGYIHEPLAYYRIHGSNLTNERIDLNIKELIHWHRHNQKKKIFKAVNFKKVINLIELLQIKKKIMQNKKGEALKLIFSKSLNFSKFKYLFFLLIK